MPFLESDEFVCVSFPNISTILQRDVGYGFSCIKGGVSQTLSVAFRETLLARVAQMLRDETSRFVVLHGRLPDPKR